jgi:hypothetical protein
VRCSEPWVHKDFRVDPGVASACAAWGGLDDIPAENA